MPSDPTTGQAIIGAESAGNTSVSLNRAANSLCCLLPNRITRDSNVEKTPRPITGGNAPLSGRIHRVASVFQVSVDRKSQYAIVRRNAIRQATPVRAV